MKSEIVDFNTYKEILLDIRNEVFTIEQSVPKELDLDGFDEVSKHIVIFDNGILVATGRIQPDGHIGRVAVIKKYRGQGVGRLIIDGLVSYAKSIGLSRVYLGAQVTAKGFYTRLDFIPYGEIFLDAGIDHIMMELDL